jgi:hypothetical protein
MPVSCRGSTCIEMKMAAPVGMPITNQYLFWTALPLTRFGAVAVTGADDSGAGLGNFACSAIRFYAWVHG